MKFERFTQYLSRLEKISSRNEITVVLAELINELDKNEVKNAMYFLQGRVAPLYVALEFSFSEKMILRAMAKVCSKPLVEITSLFKASGDIGEFVMDLLPNYKGILDINQVFEILTQIAVTSGKNSQAYKEQSYVSLLSQVSANEAKYINRILIGNLRLGLYTKTIFDALSWAMVGDKSLRNEIETAYGVRTDLGSIADYLINNGVESLRLLKVSPGIPLAPKLVEREKDVPAILKRIPQAIVQPKLDGLRIHVHFKREGFNDIHVVNELQLISDESQQKEQVRLFSRNLESLTNMFPEIVSAAKNIHVDSFIIDGEAIAINNVTGEFMAFQETMKRKRKNDISTMVESHPIKVFAFDIMELNGEDLLLRPNSERIQILEELLTTSKSEKIIAADSTATEDPELVESLFHKYLDAGYEGIIVKNPESYYKPGSRNFDWIKLKSSIDNVDGVVLGYYLGSGDRTRFGIGALLIGSYDKAREKYVSLAKVGSGFKDSDWADIKTGLDAIKLQELPDNIIISDALRPDVIVQPKFVVEVKADIITKSKLHGDEEGYSLRFPRLKFYGRDKNPEDCTSVEEIKRMFELQAN
jgi:DNA ligase-1